jgi:argininosuccinate synthase
MNRIVLAYSGDPAATAAIPRLADRYGAEVVTLTLDVGQGGELTSVRERALAAGAVRAHVIDAREELVSGFGLPALQASALLGPRGPLAVALAHALIAKRLADVARMERAWGVAYGSSSVLERCLSDLRVPGTTIALAGARDLASGDRGDRTVDGGSARVHTNLWGRTVCGGPLADLWTEVPEAVFTLTRGAAECPDDPAYLEIDFENGLPVRANGVDLCILELIESLDIIAGAHGVGRLETAAGPEAIRTIHEAPAAVVLDTARDALESLTLPLEFHRAKRGLEAVYADLVADGRWFSPARDAIDAFIRSAQPYVTGSVRLKLYTGRCRVVGRRAGLAFREVRETDSPQREREPAPVEGLTT